jgi:hypothetical protein
MCFTGRPFYPCRKMSVHFVFIRSVRWFLVTANIVPSSPILFTLIMEPLSSSEISVLTRATRRNIPESPVIYSTEGGDPRTAVDGVERGNILIPPGLEIRSPAFQPITSRHVECFLCWTRLHSLLTMQNLIHDLQQRDR